MNQKKFYYIIEIIPINSHLRFRRGDLHIARSNESQFTFANLLCISTYKFRIYSVNNYGYSLNFTEITIEKERSLPLKPRYLRVLSNSIGRYELRWEDSKESSVANIHHYIVSWCRVGSQNRFNCVGQMESQIVPVGLSKTVFSNLTGNNYNFGISSVMCMKNTFVASGITWATYIAPMKLSFTLISIAEYLNAQTGIEFNLIFFIFGFLVITLTAIMVAFCKKYYSMNYIHTFK